MFQVKQAGSKQTHTVPLTLPFLIVRCTAIVDLVLVQVFGLSRGSLHLLKLITSESMDVCREDAAESYQPITLTSFTTHMTHVTHSFHP